MKGPLCTLVCAGIALALSGAGAAPADPNVVAGLKATAAGANTVVVLSGSATPSFTAYRLSQPPRLCVDLANGRLGPAFAGHESRQLLVDTWAVGQVSIDERSGDAAQVARLFIGLKRESTYTVRPEGHDLIVTVFPSELPPAAEGRVRAEAPQPEPRSEARPDAAKKAEELALKRSLQQTLDQKNRTEDQLRRLERTRDAVAQHEQELAARIERIEKSKQQGSRELSDLQQQLLATQKEAQKAQQQVARAQDSLRQAEQARRDEEQRLLALRGEQRQAEEKLAQQRVELRAQEGRLQRLQRQATAGASVDADLERKLKETQDKAALARRELVQTQQALREEEARREQARRAREAEEARLAALTAAERRTGQEKAREEAELKLLGQKKAEVQKARPAEEARLQVLTESERRIEAEKAQHAAEILALGQRKADLEEARQAEESRYQALGEAGRRAEAEQARHAAELKLLAQRKAEVEEARQAEEAQLAMLTEAQRKAEAEQARHAAELKLLAQRKAEVEKARQAEEAQLAMLTEAHRRAEAEQARRVEEIQALGQRKAEAQKARQAEEAALSQTQRKAAAEKARYAAELQVLAQKKAEAERAQRQLVVPAPAPAPPARTAAADDQAPALATAPPWPWRRAVTLRPYQVRAEEQPPEAAPVPASLPSRNVFASAGPLPLSRHDLVPVRDVRFEDDGRVERVVIDLGGDAVETSVYTDSRTAVLNLRGASLSRELTRTLDTTAYNGPVQTVSSFPDPRNGQAVRLVVSMSRQVAPILHRKGARLLWEFPRARQGYGLRRFAPARFARFGNPSIPLQVAPPQVVAPGPPSAPPDVPVSAGRVSRRYSGRRIDLDFKDADIHNILRLLSEVGQINIVTADDVKGTVTIRMRDVPWDQALDVILKAKGLGYIREGNLIRVAPQDKLDKESEAEAARLRSKVELAPLETRLIPLSYADAGKMEKKVHELLSPRGKVTFDDRTNILIVSDMGPNIALAEDLLRNLDTQTPQVMIEARIVEARTSFTRDIGIQWGFSSDNTADRGNATGLAFPSAVHVGGGATDQLTNVTAKNGLGFNAANPDYVVNLPAAAGSGAGGALGIALGALNGNINLNLRLSAFEDSGNIRIVSSPKVMTTDGFEATIDQGVSIPVSVVSAAGANTQFFDAKLNLTVKPHVTNEGSVQMDVKITRNEPDQSITGANGVPSILKREAKTRLLVRDGETAVIGGIYTRNSGQSYQKVPGLAEIPILGWFFKNRRENDDRNELLIFLTPRIMNRSTSINPPTQGP